MSKWNKGNGGDQRKGGILPRGKSESIKINEKLPHWSSD